MEFNVNRNVGPSARTAASAGAHPGGGGRSKDVGWKSSPKWLKIVWIILLFAGTILLLAAVALLVLGNKKDESALIDDEKTQAVFLDNGQVYFGSVRTVNDSYMDLQGIYYLSVDQPVQPEQEGQQQSGNITLQKLGCELHGPIDQMIINREHITFWENLQDEGQVTKAIAEWVKQNPEGLKCPEPGQQQPTDNTNGTSQDEEDAVPEEEQNQ